MLDLKKLLTKMLQELKYSKLNTDNYTNDKGKTVSFSVDNNTGEVSVTSQSIKITPSQINGKISASNITGLPVASTSSPQPVGTSATAGTATTWSKSDHVHNISKNTITSALGYTPYNDSNPDGYGKITGISSTAPINGSGTTGTINLSHSTSGVTAGTYGSTATTTETPAFGANIVVPGFNVNNTGHITTASTHNITIPSNTFIAATNISMDWAQGEINFNTGAITTGTTNRIYNTNKISIDKDIYVYYGNDNLLYYNQTDFSSWSFYKPNSSTASINFYKKNNNQNTLVINTLDGGWQQFYSPAITVTPNQTYILSFDYKVYKSYTIEEATFEHKFGLYITKRIPDGGPPAYHDEQSPGYLATENSYVQFENTQDNYTGTAFIEFTPQDATIYLDLCIGYIRDTETNLRFDINNLRLYKQYNYSIRCYDENNNYLKASSEEYFSTPHLFTINNFEEGTNYIRLNVKEKKNKEITSSTFNNIFVSIGNKQKGLVTPPEDYMTNQTGLNVIQSHKSNYWLNANGNWETIPKGMFFNKETDMPSSGNATLFKIPIKNNIPQYQFYHVIYNYWYQENNHNTGKTLILTYNLYRLDESLKENSQTTYSVTTIDNRYHMVTLDFTFYLDPQESIQLNLGAWTDASITPKKARCFIEQDIWRT